MIGFSRTRVALALLTFLLAPIAAHAQVPTASFADLAKILKPGQTVIVVDPAGHQTEAKAVEMSAAGLVIAPITHDKLDGKPVTLTQESKTVLETEVAEIVSVSIGDGPPSTIYLAPGMLPIVRSASRLWVTMKDGTEVQGDVVSSSPSELVLRPAGGVTSASLITIPRANARRVEVAEVHHFANGPAGALIGAGVGLVPSLMICGGGCSGEFKAPFYGLFIGGGAGIGALIGAAMGATHQTGRHLIYSAAAGPASITIVPMAAPHRAGVGVTVRW